MLITCQGQNILRDEACFAKFEKDVTNLDEHSVLSKDVKHLGLGEIPSFQIWKHSRHYYKIH